MATDVARQSFDAARRFTGVSHQQGRVTLEAEENEQRRILADASRHELLDLVGPAGTPDDGYRISVVDGDTDVLTIGAGTMYVGGVRVSLDEDVLYAAQPDWLDCSSDQDYVPVTQEGHWHVVLVLTEYDVTATEDPALREVALGGPDGGARTRIVQRVQLLKTTADDCPDAAQSDVDEWAKRGLRLDPQTLELRSASRLHVTWVTPKDTRDPCEPASTGGYLGAENQVIRIQVAAVYPDRFDLVWGWDNASFLYRVTTGTSTWPVLKLDRQPVDHKHRPRAGQAVELLPAAARLSSTDGVVEGLVAEHRGRVGVLAEPYDPDHQSVSVKLPWAVPTQWTAKDSPGLYMRVWEELLPGRNLKQDIVLGTTGVQVRLDVENGSALHVGDHWSVAVRPQTPTTVLPARLARMAQPPDGPRMWACPLAVLASGDDNLKMLDDCRKPFRPLSAGDTGCCTVRVTPSAAKVNRLQQIIDEAVAARPKPDRTHRVTICLAPGRYELRQPLRLEQQHGHLHLEGCGDGVVLAAAPSHEKAFAQGLVVLIRADDVRISAIEFELPLVPAKDGGVKPADAELKTFGDFSDLYKSLSVSVGVRPLGCTALEVDHCMFRVPANQSQEELGPHFGAGVFAGCDCRGLIVEHNRFARPAGSGQLTAGQAGKQMLAGLLVSPIIAFGLESNDQGGLPDSVLLPSLLTDASVRDNDFAGVTFGVVAFADLGDVRIQDNTAIGCYGGIVLTSLQGLAFIDYVSRFTPKQVVDTPIEEPAKTVMAAVLDDLQLWMSLVSRTYPLPAGFTPTAVESEQARQAANDRAKHVNDTHGIVFAAFQTFFLLQFKGAQQPLIGESAPKAARGRETPSGTEAAAGAARGGPTPSGTAEALSLSEMEWLIAVTPRRNLLRLRCTGNDIDCVRRREQGATTSGGALLVWSPDVPADGDKTPSALVSDNRLAAVRRSPVAVTIDVQQVVATGNLVRNKMDDGQSMALLGNWVSAEVAVTGNVMSGPAVLPSRELPAPLDDWRALNTVTP